MNSSMVKTSVIWPDALFNVHARNGRISTSDLKSDIIFMFFGPDFLKDVKILAICKHFRQI